MFFYKYTFCKIWQTINISHEDLDLQEAQQLVRLKSVCLSSLAALLRQWPEVYDLCHTFLHVARVKKPTAMRESHAIARDYRMAVGFLTF